MMDQTRVPYPIEITVPTVGVYGYRNDHELTIYFDPWVIGVLTCKSS